MGTLRNSMRGFVFLTSLLCVGGAGCSASRVAAVDDSAPGPDAALVDAARDDAAVADASGADGGGGPEAGQDSGSIFDAGHAERDGDARTDGDTGDCVADGGCPDAATPPECPGDFTVQPGACPSDWTCFSPAAAPAMLCGVRNLRATDCEEAGAIVVPDPGDGSAECPADGFIGTVSYGIEGALCCARPRIDCGACEPASSGAFGCDGAQEQLWECFSGAVPEVMPLLCRDLATGIPRYCCDLRGAPVCEEGT